VVRKGEIKKTKKKGKKIKKKKKDKTGFRQGEGEAPGKPGGRRGDNSRVDSCVGRGGMRSMKGMGGASRREVPSLKRV